MSGSRRLLAELHGRGSDQGESMDVLLQLTLPIILILAFVVATEMRSLKEDLTSANENARELAAENAALDEELQILVKEMDGTETGRLYRQLDLAILTLQHQLLLKAVAEVVAGEREALGLGEFPSLTPGVKDLLDEQVNPRFASVSNELAGRFNGEGRSDTRARLEDAVVARFEALVDGTLADGEVSSLRHRQLREIVPENRASFVAQLAGELDAMAETAAGVQLEVMLAWIASPAAEQAVKAGSSQAWRAIQTDNDEAMVREQVKDFVNLKALLLVERLRNLDIPLLDRTCLLVVNQLCSEIS